MQHIKTESQKDKNTKQTNKKGIESVIKNFPTKKNPGPNAFTGEFYQISKELILIFLILFQKTEDEGTLKTHFMRPASL